MSSDALGPMEDRVKTDMRLPQELVEAIEKVCEAVGTKKNGFFVLAAAYFCAQLAPVIRNKGKRALIIREIEKMFQKVLEEAKKDS